MLYIHTHTASLPRFTQYVWNSYRAWFWMAFCELSMCVSSEQPPSRCARRTNDETFAERSEIIIHGMCARHQCIYILCVCVRACDALPMLANISQPPINKEHMFVFELTLAVPGSTWHYFVSFNSQKTNASLEHRLCGLIHPMTSMVW